MHDDATRRTGAQVPVSTGKPFKGMVSERWELLEPIGEGGMSDVYRARHVIMQKIGAVKFLKGELAEDPIAVKRFEQEATASSCLAHKNIVQVLDCGVSEHGMYIILEFLEGLSLCDILDDRAAQAEDGRGKLSVEEALPIFIQVLDGLDHAHKKGVVHRDMKPSNIMLVNDNDGSIVVKIVDFGIAKLLESADGALTRPGEVFGSPLYMSPEQCLGKGLDGRSDVYSVGCMMYEALTGKRLFFGRNPTETMMKHVQDAADLTTLARLEHNLSEALVTIISHATAKNAEERFASAAAMRDALIELEQSLGPAKKQSGRGAVPEEKAAARHLRPLLVGVLIAGLLVLVLFAGTVAYSFMPVASSSSLTHSLGETVYEPKWQPRPVLADKNATVEILKADHLLQFLRPAGGWTNVVTLENFIQRSLRGARLATSRNEFSRTSTLCKQLLKDLSAAFDPEEALSALVVKEGKESEIYRTLRDQYLETVTLYTYCSDALLEHPSPDVSLSEAKTRRTSGEELLDTQLESNDVETVCNPAFVIDGYRELIWLLHKRGDRKDCLSLTKRLMDFWYKQNPSDQELSMRGLYQFYLADLYRLSGAQEASPAFARAIQDLKRSQFGRSNKTEKELLGTIYLRYGIALKEKAHLSSSPDKDTIKDAFGRFGEAARLFSEAGNIEMAKASKGEAYLALKSYDPLQALVFRLQNGV